MLLVLFEGLGEDEDIVKVDDHQSIQERPEQVVHESLESAGSIAEAERHNESLVVAVSRLECGLVDVFFEDLDLVVSAFELDLGEEFGATKPVEEIVDSGKRVSILYGLLVERTIVVADAQCAILLGNEQDWRCVRGRAGADSAGIDFFFNEVPKGFEFPRG